mmetsp:Transcript_12408/g.26570  ORF Transcript_12408/g.26570 Transcript_12408/m.26570 type:complete len:246 (-) Transcript_12408:16-753(-)
MTDRQFEIMERAKTRLSSVLRHRRKYSRIGRLLLTEARRRKQLAASATPSAVHSGDTPKKPASHAISSIPEAPLPEAVSVDLGFPKGNAGWQGAPYPPSEARSSHPWGTETELGSLDGSPYSPASAPSSPALRPWSAYDNDQPPEDKTVEFDQLHASFGQMQGMDADMTQLLEQDIKRDEMLAQSKLRAVQNVGALWSGYRSELEKNVNKPLFEDLYRGTWEPSDGDTYPRPSADGGDLKKKHKS